MDFAVSVMEEFKNSVSDNNVNMSEMKYHPIIDVIRVLGKNLQSKYLTHLLFSENVNRLPNIESWEVMFDIREPLTKDRKFFSDLKIELEIEKEIHLCKDVILPWPWARSRLIKSITRTGKGRARGPWKQDFSNHSTELWLPFGITWVNGGNHSIAAGIIQGEGVIKPDYIFDISQVYEHIFCDGLYYRRISDNSIISVAQNIEFAAIFEIGRIMVQNSISF